MVKYEDFFMSLKFQIQKITFQKIKMLRFKLIMSIYVNLGTFYFSLMVVYGHHYKICRWNFILFSENLVQQNIKEVFVTSRSLGNCFYGLPDLNSRSSPLCKIYANMVVILYNFFILLIRNLGALRS